MAFDKNPMKKLPILIDFPSVRKVLLRQKNFFYLETLVCKLDTQLVFMVATHSKTSCFLILECRLFLWLWSKIHQRLVVHFPKSIKPDKNMVEFWQIAFFKFVSFYKNLTRNLKFLFLTLPNFYKQSYSRGSSIMKQWNVLVCAWCATSKAGMDFY